MVKIIKVRCVDADRPVMESSHVGLGRASIPPPADIHTDVLGRRFWAAMVDGLILGVLFGVLSVVTHGTRTQTVYGPGGYPVTTHIAALSGGTVLVFLAISLGYYFVLESMLGQTLGKMTLGIQVVGLDGRAASTGQVLVRTVGRIVDGLPFFFIVGFISLISGQPPRKRVGDRMARTTVARV
jgi:uncharacterized RDD family membrane protein YckC